MNNHRFLDYCEPLPIIRNSLVTTALSEVHLSRQALYVCHEGHRFINGKSQINLHCDVAGHWHTENYEYGCMREYLIIISFIISYYILNLTILGQKLLAEEGSSAILWVTYVYRN